MEPSKPILQNPKQLAASGAQEHNLNTWNGPRMAERLLLDIQYECARNNVDLPWDRIAHRMNPGSSSSAIHHYLWRTRQQLIVEGHVVPPQVGLGGLHAANNGSDARGFVRDPEERVDLTTTGAVGWNEFHCRRLNLSDAVDAFDVETSKGKKTTKTDFFEDHLSPEVDDYTTVALQTRRCSVEKNPCAVPESGEDEAEVMVHEENPFDDCYEWKEEAKDGGVATVDAMGGTDWDWMQLGDTVSQVNTFAADNAGAATAHARTRQLSVVRQANLQPCGSFFGAAQPRLASMDDPLLEKYNGDLSLNPAHTHNITEWSPSYTVHSGAAAAQLAADLGYGQSAETLFSHAVDNLSAFGPVAPSQFLRSEDRPIEVQEGSPTPTTRNPRLGTAKNKSTARPTTPTPKRKQRPGTPMSSFEADEEADLTPRATASSSSRRASGTARTASVEPSRLCGSGSKASAVMQDILDNRWNGDDDIFHSFPGIGIGGPGKSSPELEDEDES